LGEKKRGKPIRGKASSRARNHQSRHSEPKKKRTSRGEKGEEGKPSDGALGEG